jgi:hypothetical protein
MKKTSLIVLTTAFLVLTVAAFKTSNAENAEEAKSVAWYTANIREAKIKNQQCHDDPGIKSSQECLNAQHALEISFGVASK